MGKDFIDIFGNDLIKTKSNLHSQLYYYEGTLFCLRGSPL